MEHVQNLPLSKIHLFKFENRVPLEGQGYGISENKNRKINKINRLIETIYKILKKSDGL